MALTLQSPSEIQGTFTGTKRSGSGSGGDGDGTPNTLIITGITGADLRYQSRHGYSVGIFPAGTSDKDMQADFMAFFAESGNIAYLIAGSDEPDTPTTIFASLVTLDTESPWTGSGIFNIGLILYDGDVAYIYRATNISITSASTSIAMSSFSKITEYDYSDLYYNVTFVDGDRVIDIESVFPGVTAIPPSDLGAHRRQAPFLEDNVNNA
jgi:hypothetical protein